MDIPGIKELKAIVMEKAGGKMVSSMLEKVGMNDMSTVNKIFSDFDLDSFNKLSTEDKISKVLTVGGAGLAGVGLIGMLGKTAGVDMLNGFSDNTFPIVLGVGAVAAIAGLGIPMYEKYKQNQALEANQNATHQLEGKPVSMEGVSIDAMSNKVGVLNDKFATPTPELPRPALPKPI